MVATSDEMNEEQHLHPLLVISKKWEHQQRFVLSITATT